MSLCNWLAWWTNRDAQRVDRLFRQSGLMREKWDRRQSGSTYGAITVQNAVAAVRQGYNPQALSGEKRGFEQLMGKGTFATFATFATDRHTCRFRREYCGEHTDPGGNGGHFVPGRIVDGVSIKIHGGNYAGLERTLVPLLCGRGASGRKKDRRYICPDKAHL